MDKEQGMYIVLLSIHGLIRGEDLELGRDADTGGQTKYVVELAKALGRHPQIAQVDLITRRLVDNSVGAEYQQPIENLLEKARIVRIDCGENTYIPKEQLWDCLDSFADSILQYLKEQPRLPSLLHSHYADAGYVGTRLSHLLATPLVHTGHSLGRSKRRRLLAGGYRRNELENRYRLSHRIEAEENVLGVADCVITSTRQEIVEQYAAYDQYQPDRMRVIPPGTDLTRFYPARGDELSTPIAEEIARFLKEPEKPIILALSRPDPRKNILQLITAYGESKALQDLANLVIISGNRDDITELEEDAQNVLVDLLLHVDQFDLYGKVAYPKHHQADEVSIIYRMAAFLGGVFINPALTEPFGLTLIEAAACGLPIVATDDGGPTDILGNCANGFLIDPLDSGDIEDKLLQLLRDKKVWQKFSANGIAGVKSHYSWEAHVKTYLEVLEPIATGAMPSQPFSGKRRKRLHHDRALFSDLDQNLLGDPDALKGFNQAVVANRKCVLFGIATGRRLDAAIKIMKKNGIPMPNVLITSLGTAIHYNPNLVPDAAWELHLDYLWNPRIIRRIVRDLPGIKLQPKLEQSRYKLSYYIDPEVAPEIPEINRMLHQEGQAANVIQSFGQFLDFVPVRASKGLALRWVAENFDIPLDRILAAGGSGADEDMMRGNMLAVVVANRHNEELSGLIPADEIFFAEKPFAGGILEAIDYYDFFTSCEVPDR